MLLYVTDALDASEAADIRAHLATGCPECAGSLAEAQALVAHLPHALDLIAPPSSARERLIERVTSHDQTNASNASMPIPQAAGRGTAKRLFLTGAIAAAIGALISAAVLYLPIREQAKLVDNRNVQLVSLAGAGKLQPEARGRIFWDRQSNDWHVFVYDLKPPPAGKEYELWFITADQKKIPAGILTVDATGKASLKVKVPQNVGPLALAAVTDEPTGGVQQPTGSIQLVGELK